MTTLLAFLDEVDELCDDLPEWYPQRAERIEAIKQHALKLCRQCVQDSKDADHDDDTDQVRTPPDP